MANKGWPIGSIQSMADGVNRQVIDYENFGTLRVSANKNEFVKVPAQHPEN
jgi:hypothetical protein